MRVRTRQRCASLSHWRRKLGSNWHRLGCERLEDRHLLAIISGTVWQEMNDDGVNNPTEPGVPGVTVFLDHNRNDSIDSGEQTTVTDAAGQYTFNVAAGDYNVATVPKDGWERLTMDRLIGLVTSPTHFFRASTDRNAALLEIDPETGHGVNKTPIRLRGNPTNEDMNFSGLAADPNMPGRYYSLAYEHGSGIFNDATSYLIELSCIPSVECTNSADPWDTGYDYAVSPGVAFDPTDPSARFLYGGPSDNITGFNVPDGDYRLWRIDWEDPNIFAVDDIGTVTEVSSYSLWGDMAFDDSGNLFILDTRFHHVSKTTAQILSSVAYRGSYTGSIRGGLEYNPKGGDFFFATDRLYRLDQVSGKITPIGPSFGPPFDGGPDRVRIQGLELFEDLSNDRPVTITHANSSEMITGIDFGHTFHGVGILGTVFNDMNANGIQEPWEFRLRGWTVFLDHNLNGVRDVGEQSIQTNAAGGYSFPNLPPALYTVAVEGQSQWYQTYPDNFPIGPRHHVNLRPADFFTADFGVAQVASIAGNVYDDINANGQRDEPEGPIIAATVYVDQNRNGVLDQHVGTFQSTASTSLADNFTVRVPLFVGGLGDRISDVNVQLDIRDNFADELEVALVSPIGTRVELFSDVGAAHDRFTSTWLDDEASKSIDEATAPFQGTFRPEPGGFLSDFDGEQPGGTWYLEVSDTDEFDPGTLNHWQLRITTGDISTTTDDEGDYHFERLPPGTHEVRTEFLHDWTPIEPRAIASQKVASFENDLGDLNGFYPIASDFGRNPALVLPVGVNGSLALEAGDWIYGTDTDTSVRKGDTISVQVRMNGDSQGRLQGGGAWFGFGADGERALAIRLSPQLDHLGSTGQGSLAITSWSDGYSKARTLVEVDQVYQANVWYRLEVQWGRDDSIVARLFAPDGRLLNTIAGMWPTDYDSGWVGFRARGNSEPIYFDDVTTRSDGGRSLLVSAWNIVNTDFGAARDGRVGGEVFYDANGNEIPDGETALSNRTIYVDSNRNGQRDEQTKEIASSETTSIFDLRAAVSQIELADMDGLILDVDVRLDITHAFNSDLDVFLISPQGTRVELFTDVGTSTQNFTDTVLNDEAPQLISNQVPAPFTGTFQPEGNLSDFDGEDPNGMWRLIVVDDSVRDEGLLNNWSVEITYGDPAAVSDTSGNFLLEDLPAGALYELRQEHRTGWLDNVPAAGLYTVRLDSGQSQTGRQFASTKRGAVRGTVWHDLNSNGFLSAAEPGLGGQLVFLDVDDDASVSNGFREWWSGAGPSIPDLKTVASPIVVEDASGLISSVTVTLDIAHRYAADLEAALISPSGTRVELFDSVGGGGDNFLQTVFDDEAASSIATGVAPFTGRFRPTGTLADLQGEDPNGVWLLQVGDNSVIDDGWINRWTLSLSYGDPTTVTGQGGQYSFDNALPGERNVRTELIPGWEHSFPTDGQHLATVVAENTTAGKDFGVFERGAISPVRAWGPNQIGEGSEYRLNLGAPNELNITSWEIDWGDGSSDTIVGNPLSVAHVYADGPATVAISAVAIDSAGQQHRAESDDPRIELESMDQSSRWMLNGSAMIGVPDSVDNSDVLRLTGPNPHESGSAFLTDPIPFGPDMAFSTQFAFRMSQSGGVAQPGPDGTGGDGLLFVMHADPRGAEALGQDMGVGGGEDLIAPSLSVEFDTWQGGWTEDPDGNHIGVNVAPRERPIGLTYPRINFSDTPNSAQGRFAGDAAFPLGDGDDFVMHATATLTVDADEQGEWTFGVNSDDGVSLKIAAQTVISDDTRHPPIDHFGTINLVPGDYSLELLYFEHFGGAALELFAAPGAHTAFNSSFHLINSVNGPGLHTTPAGFSVRQHRSMGVTPNSAGLVPNLSAAERLVSGVPAAVINYSDFRGRGRFAGDSLFPFGDGDDFAIRATGTIDVSPAQAGDWTFGVNSDDGSRLLVDGQIVIYDDSHHPQEDRFGTIPLSPGEHTLDLIFFEHTGISTLELFAAPGLHSRFGNDFQLVNSSGGLPLTGSGFTVWQYRGEVLMTSLATAEVAMHLGPRSIASQPVLSALNTEQIHYAWVDYDGQVMEVRVHDAPTRPNAPTLSVPLSLSELFGDVQNLYVGFTAGTGDGVNDHAIRAWDFHAPNPAVTVQILNVAPTVDAGPDRSVSHGTPFSTMGSFDDPGNDAWTATVDYGDGSGLRTLALNSDKTYSLHHTYSQAGTYAVNVVVTDSDGVSGGDSMLVVSAPGPKAVIFADGFGDDDLTTNDDGFGTGWTTATFGGGGSETESAFRFDGRALADWNLFEISSVDTFPVWTDAPTRFQFQTGNVSIIGDGTSPPAFVDPELQQQIGVLSANEPRSGSGGGPDFNEANFFQNTAGGLFVEFQYQLEDTGEVSAQASIRAANQFKPAWQFADEVFGIFTPVTMVFDGFDARNILLTTMSVSRDGWSVEFSEPFSVTTRWGQVEQLGNVVSGSWGEASLGDAAITTELQDGTFLLAMGQNHSTGRGSVDLLDVRAFHGDAILYPPDLAEPNDVSSRPFHLGFDDQTYDGLTIHSAADEDWYRWDASRDGMLSVNIYAESGSGDLNLFLYSDEGELLEVSANTGDHDGIIRQVHAGDSYLLQVKGSKATTTQPSYKVGVSNGPLKGEFIYVAVGQEIRVFDIHGVQVDTIQDPILEDGTLGDVEIGPEGFVYVSMDIGDDAGDDGKIVHFTPNGNFSSVTSVPDDPFTRNARYPFGFDVLDDGTFLVAQPNSGRIIHLTQLGTVLDTFVVGPARPSDVTVKTTGEIVFADDTQGESMVNGIPQGKYWLAERGSDKTTLRDAKGTVLETHNGVRPIDADASDRGTLYISELTSLAPFEQGRLRALDQNGQTMFNVAIPGLPLGVATSRGYQVPPPKGLIDSDEDGLADIWETQGLDVNGDGLIDLDLPALGADPMHKDLFVEIDAMTGRAPSTMALTRVKNAFASVPNRLLGNPDGRDGIDLHITLDETNIPLSDFTVSESLPWIEIQSKTWQKFDPIKAARFGTPSDRAEANWQNIRDAKELTYRYGLFAHNYVTTNSAGLAELPGNDFLVTLGKAATVGGTEDEQAATLMHELGHTLNLQHGGGDDINYKPNYHSIMNYHWTFPNTNGNVGWTLDYSREAAMDLDESNLDESDGLGFPNGVAHAAHRVAIGPYKPNPDLANETGAYDFSEDDADGDGNSSNDTNVQRDLNAGFTSAHNDVSPGQILRGYSDWSNLQLGLAGHTNFADGVHLNAPLREQPLGTSGIATIDDSFDDGNLATNEDGSGSGWSSATFGGGGSETASAFMFDGASVGDWNLWEISSQDSFEILAHDTTVQFNSGHVRISQDNQNLLGPEWVGLQGTYDFRQQLGVVSANEPKSGSGGTGPHNEAYFYNNTSGGLFVDIAYERDTSFNDLTVVGHVRAANKHKPESTLDESQVGIFTPATFRFSAYDGQDELITTFTLTADGWTIGLSEEIIVETHAPGVVVTGNTISGDWTSNSLDDAAISDEFVNGAFALAMSQNIWAGRGNGEILSAWVQEHVAMSDHSGDFNGDGQLTCLDIDSLVAQIAADTNAPAFDITQDGLVNNADLNAWLALGGDANLPSRQSYLSGDANLDGKVNAIDLNLLALNWRGTSAGWCGGDFTADGNVSAPDLNALAVHWRQDVSNALPIAAALVSRLPRAPLVIEFRRDAAGFFEFQSSTCRPALRYDVLTRTIIFDQGTWESSPSPDIFRPVGLGRGPIRRRILAISVADDWLADTGWESHVDTMFAADSLRGHGDQLDRRSNRSRSR